MWRYVPLLAVLLVGWTFLLAAYSDWIDAMLSRLAFWLFRGERVQPAPKRERLLRTAAIGTPYREYVTKTYLYVLGLGTAGAILGVYVGIGLLVLGRSLGIESRPSLPSPGIFTNAPDVSWLGPLLARVADFDGIVFLWLLAASATAAVFGAVGTYLVRWKVPSLRADTRRRQIDAGMPQMVAFVYALTRGGMAFPDVLRALSRNQGIFGEGATEFGVAVRNIDLFGVDLVTAVQDLSKRTPSEQFEKFTENLASVLQSGRNLSAFLHEQYERYREEAEEQQEEILELLATTAEVYVTVVVAGILFLVTILLIIGLTAGDTLLLIQLIAYVVLPLANLLFLAYLAEVTGPLRATRDDDRTVLEDSTVRGTRGPSRTDGGYTRQGSRANHDRLRAYERVRSLAGTVASPVKSAIDRPMLVLYVTVPIAVAVTAYRLPAAFVAGSLAVEVLDDIVVQAVLFVMGTFAAFYEVNKRRSRRLEESIPDLLERLASLNEAGIAVVSSFERVRGSDIGALDQEVERIWRDVQWGATVAQALDRFERRVRTPSITRVVTLITNAMRASNEIGPVLRIAAEQARADRRLRRQRRQEMLTYLVVIYVSFVVFLIVIAALDYVLIPNLPDTSGISVQNGPSILGSFSGGDEDAYRRAFFHTALIQSTLSGLVGGMMGGGSIKDGVKHATVMLAITYAVLTLLG
ncbi:type II secretion system F family protein [Natronomonas salina]|uniref:type II secretion system F family protein n=1 Tax=Natronomonas salina TaxID=1710540 RepID=UPI0015B3B603|nr:type II secretion system F family protein [Natronomonas salina]QLD87539.1 type II secretion system F family protein [Natronomonas salina]